LVPLALLRRGKTATANFIGFFDPGPAVLVLWLPKVHWSYAQVCNKSIKILLTDNFCIYKMFNSTE